MSSMESEYRWADEGVSVPSEYADAVTGAPGSKLLGSRHGGRLHVALTSEGTYPHFKGGVSTWCHTLISQMPEVDFTLWALMMNPYVSEQYELPSNVVDFVGVPMWGIEEPAEYTRAIPASRMVGLSRTTTEHRVAEGFPVLLEELMREIGSVAFDPYRFASLLLRMHEWFEENDYRATFRSRSTWEIAKAVLLETNVSDVGAPGSDLATLLSSEELRRSPERGPTFAEARERFRGLRHVERPEEGSMERDAHLPTLNDATEGLRWLYRLLMPVNTPIVQADVFHSSAAAFCGIPALLSKLSYGTPFLLTEHGVYMREQYLAIGRYGYPYHLKKFIIQMIAAVSRTCFAFADQVSPVCHYNSRWELRNGVDASRLRVIYNGVDPAVYTPRPVRRPAAPTVVTLARIDPLKDLETYLAVADEVRRQVPDVQFLHWGPAVDAEYNDKIRALHKKLKLEGIVHFLGVTEDPSGAINQGDVVVLTSISEAFPYTVVEALMCGKPVVATDVGGVREALDGTGTLTRPGDVGALAEGIVRFLRMDRESRAVLSTQCRDRALRYFTVSAAVEAYRSTYRRLAELPRRPLVEIPTLPSEAAPAPEFAPTTVAAGVVAATPAATLGVQVPAAAGVEPGEWATSPATAAVGADEAPVIVAPGTAAVPLAETVPSAVPDEVVAPTPEPVTVPAVETVVVSAGETAVTTSPTELPLLERLAHPDPAVRRAAVLDARVAGGPGAMAALGDVLARDPDVEVRAAALAAMASMVAREVI
ncbi:MAG: GT4 family glycosyltransferase PelF [Actinomycetota bacterium]|nr:GT4 family glycosyltransferase PelF [Actinomycetota bacterium]